MVRPTLGSTHSLSDTYIVPVPVPDDDVVDEMPVLGARMGPCYILIITKFPYNAFVSSVIWLTETTIDNSSVKTLRK